jgi:putative hydrolase of the HAD superfamily
MPIKALIFDWGDTVMRDFNLPGPMSEWDRVEAVPGVKMALEILSKKYTLIIATSAAHSDSTDMKRALARSRLANYFSHFYSLKELGTSKPDPAFFTKALELSGFSKDEVTGIGNLYEKDIVSAKAAGLTTIFFNENKLEGDFHDADHMIHTMGELPDLLEPKL